MFLQAKCPLSVSSVDTVHRRNNKVGKDKNKRGRRKTKRQEFRLILALGVSLFDKEEKTTTYISVIGVCVFFLSVIVAQQRVPLSLFLLL